MTEEPIKVFFSYSHRDEDFKDELVNHLSILRYQGVISDWHDRMIVPGSDWEREIDRNLEEADIILLMVSSDFLASSYCWGVEVKKAVQRHEAGEAFVIPVVLRQTVWEWAPIAKLQALPKNAKPIKSWADQDEAFCDVARGIEAATRSLRQMKRQRQEAEQQAEERKRREAKEREQQEVKRQTDLQRQIDEERARLEEERKLQEAEDQVEKGHNVEKRQDEQKLLLTHTDQQGKIQQNLKTFLVGGTFVIIFVIIVTVVLINNIQFQRDIPTEVTTIITSLNQPFSSSQKMAQYYFFRGVEKLKKGNDQGAISDYDQAIKIKPDFSEAYHNRGSAHSALGDNQAAIADYNQAIQLNPDEASTFLLRGIAHFNLGDYQGAISDYSQAIQLNPSFAISYFARGVIYKNQGEKKRAIADFQKAANLYQQQGFSRMHQNALDLLKDLQS